MYIDIIQITNSEENKYSLDSQQHSSGAALQFSLLFQFLQKDPYGSGNMYQLIP